MIAVSTGWEQTAPHRLGAIMYFWGVGSMSPIAAWPYRGYSAGAVTLTGDVDLLIWAQGRCQ